MLRWSGRSGSQGEGIAASIERLIWTVRTGDMIDTVKTYIGVLSSFASAGTDADDNQAKAQALDDLANHITRAAPGFAPLNNSGLVIQRLAKRVESGDPILSESSLSRILQCITDVFDKFLATAVVQATKKCEEASYDTIAVHAWGSLTTRCASLIASSSRNPKILVFGAKARDLAPKLRDLTKARVTVLPPLFSYQAAGMVEAVIFQAETITPVSILARLGSAQVAESPLAPSNLDIVAVTLSLAYQPRRGAVQSAYKRLPSASFRLEWQETIDVPLFDIIFMQNIRGNLNIIDEKGATKAKPAILRKKALSIVKELEDLVEARCRVYEPS